MRTLTSWYTERKKRGEKNRRDPTKRVKILQRLLEGLSQCVLQQKMISSAAERYSRTERISVRRCLSILKKDRTAFVTASFEYWKTRKMRNRSNSKRIKFYWKRPAKRFYSPLPLLREPKKTRCGTNGSVAKIRRSAKAICLIVLRTGTMMAIITACVPAVSSSMALDCPAQERISWPTSQSSLSMLIACVIKKAISHFVKHGLMLRRKPS